jgi:hypothetical protein
LDFFDPADGRYEYRPKKERKNTAALLFVPVCPSLLPAFVARNLFSSLLP